MRSNTRIIMTIKEKIDQLRADLHRHNYNYYVLNTPEISDKEFDDRMRELQELEKEHPEYQDENSPTMRVGSDLKIRRYIHFTDLRKWQTGTCRNSWRR